MMRDTLHSVHLIPPCVLCHMHKWTKDTTGYVHFHFKKIVFLLFVILYWYSEVVKKRKLEIKAGGNEGATVE